MSFSPKMFTDAQRIYLCDFHRRQAWARWLRTKDHGVSDYAEEIVGILQHIALADTFEKMEIAIANLRSSSHYLANSKFRHWIETRWIMCKEVAFSHYFD